MVYPKIDQGSIRIKTAKLKNGFAIAVFGKKYKVEYPEAIWQSVPDSIRKVLLENITYASTHFLPLMLNSKKVVYDDIAQPILETFFFKNQLYDLLDCERSDNRPHLSLLKKFYNLDYEFESGESSWPDNNISFRQSKKDIVILPFTFGKESLLTFALCREIGIKPILVYCQEPAHPYEEKYKLKKLKEFGREFGVITHFIKNEPGLFRYGKAFGIKKITEIGWGTQTTNLSLLMIPFVYYYQAKYILFGNEYANNEWEWVKEWKVYSAGYDQTSDWTVQQNNIVRLFANNQCQVKSSLEFLEEINIFYCLHHRYPQIGRYQFSCSGQAPLYKNSAWCQQCYKCARMFLFAQACGIDPRNIGFKSDLLQKPNMFPHYFGKMHKSGSKQELDFSFFLLYKKGIKTYYSEQFKKKKLKQLKPWKWYCDYYTKLKPARNLPFRYKQKIKLIFQREIKEFAKILPK